MSDRSPTVDLDEPRSVHIVAAGGAGMSAIGVILRQQGHTVTGSDLRTGPGVDALAAEGVEVVIGHSASNLPVDVDLVFVSTAVADDNPEIIEAVRRGVPVLRRTSSLAVLTAGRRVVAVAGTHGKTTTSSMLTLILIAAGIDPGFLVGAAITGLGVAARNGSGEWFVLEADESDGSFLAAARAVAIVTNIEADHLEHHGSLAGLVASFERFVDTTDGPVVVCADDPGSAALAQGREGVVTYGERAEATYRLVEVRSDRTGVRWVVRRTGYDDLPLEVAAPGRHHALNATAAAAAALEMGVSPTAVQEGLARYRGVARRFEHRGVAAGVTFIDDYAHLPTEVAAAVAAAIAGGWSRVVGVFQPHRYSRTEQLWRDFSDSFEGLDRLVLTGIYPAGEPPRRGVDGGLLVGAVLDAHPRAEVAYIPDLGDLPRYLWSVLRPGDLCLTMGAGDVTTLPDSLVAAAPRGHAERST